MITAPAKGALASTGVLHARTYYRVHYLNLAGSGGRLKPMRSSAVNDPRQDPRPRRPVRRGSARSGVERGPERAHQGLGDSPGRLLPDHSRRPAESIPSHAVIPGADLFG